MRTPSPKNEEYRLDLIRVGLARAFRLDRVWDPVEECRRRGVSEQRMIEQATEFDLYGRSLRQGGFKWES